jgi:anti-sigma factor RsiW
MRGDDTRRQRAAGLPDRALWQRCCMIDMEEDEAERFLDLAGFADGRLDPDDRERVAELLAGDPAAATDIAAARTLAEMVDRSEAAPESVVARACALVDDGAPQGDTVTPFPPSRRDRPRLHGMASWGSLAAAMAVASWLGFALGMDTSLSFAQIRQPGEDGFLRELLDPATPFMRDLTEGAQT